MKTCKYDPETSLYGMVTGLWQGLESSVDSVVSCIETVGSPKGPRKTIIKGSRRAGIRRNNKRVAVLPCGKTSPGKVYQERNKK